MCAAQLQVEHPVTEWISGVNIPSCQLMIGMGVPLNRIPDIRRLYGQDPKGTSQIEYDSDPQIPPSGAPARRRGMSLRPMLMPRACSPWQWAFTWCSLQHARAHAD